MRQGEKQTCWEKEFKTKSMHGLVSAHDKLIQMYKASREGRV